MCLKEYPTHLLPQNHYKEIGISNELREYYLIRHTQYKDVTFKDSTTINPDCINFQSGELKDLSTNLLSIFKTEDIKFQIVKDKLTKFCCLWVVGETPDIPDQNDFEIIEDRGFFSVKIDDIMGKEISCCYNDPKGSPLTMTVIIQIIHTPTKCNFWHFSIRIIDKNNNSEIESLSISKTQKRNIYKSAKDFISKIATVEINDLTLDDKYYSS